MPIALHDLYTDPDRWSLPYALLQEREPEQNISHREMPTWEDHCAYVSSRPHLAWYWFASDGEPAGCVYLSNQREIGIGVLKAFRGRRLAREAIRELMALHPGRFLANIAPQNFPSSRLFHSLGFRFVQVTYLSEPDRV